MTTDKCTNLLINVQKEPTEAQIEAAVKAVNSDKSFGELTTLKRVLMTEESVKKLGESINKITKTGFSVPMTWEALAGPDRKGHYEPVGNKYTQWIAWWIGKQLFRYWKFVERWLMRFRHFEGVGGYDWEEAEYREFKQKTRRSR